MVVIEYMGFDKDIYSMFHYKDYSITLVQNSTGQLIAVSYESDEEIVEEPFEDSGL